jgi:hypothetical protein
MAEESETEIEKQFVSCGQMMKGMAGGSGTTTCPMAAAFKDASEKPMAGAMVMIPGLILIALGVAILIEPRILAWLMAALAILLGLIVLMIANFVRKVGARLRTANR